MAWNGWVFHNITHHATVFNLLMVIFQCELSPFFLPFHRLLTFALVIDEGEGELCNGICVTF